MHTLGTMDVFYSKKYNPVQGIGALLKPSNNLGGDKIKYLRVKMEIRENIRVEKGNFLTEDRRLYNEMDYTCWTKLGS